MTRPIESRIQLLRNRCISKSANGPPSLLSVVVYRKHCPAVSRSGKDPPLQNWATCHPCAAQNWHCCKTSIEGIFPQPPSLHCCHKRLDSRATILPVPQLEKETTQKPCPKQTHRRGAMNPRISWSQVEPVRAIKLLLRRRRCDSNDEPHAKA